MPSKNAARAGGAKPLEYSILYTATLALLAFGAVMVYSASSTENLLSGHGDPAYYLKRYVALAIVGLVVMTVLARRGLALVKTFTPLVLLAGFALTFAVMLPGVGVTVNGATRWLGAGPLQFQPSEILKVALVLYAAQLLAARPSSLQTLGGMCKPLLIVVGFACVLLLKQPDMGTAIVICMAITALLIVAGAKIKHLATVLGVLACLALIVALAEPYRRERLTAFLDPWADASDTGFQTVQAMIAIGSGGIFGVGLGESVQKAFYLPEAHTDMILAIIGEELGLVGMLGVTLLYGMIAYAGLRAAKAARDRYSKLLAAGLTSLILCQASVNFFAVMGLAPLTGVPLPFISYGNSNLVVMLAAMGLLLNVAATGGLAARSRRRPGLRAIEGGRGAASGDRRRRDGGTRRAGSGRRGRATG